MPDDFNFFTECIEAVVVEVLSVQYLDSNFLRTTSSPVYRSEGAIAQHTKLLNLLRVYFRRPAMENLPPVLIHKCTLDITHKVKNLYQEFTTPKKKYLTN